MSLAVYTGSQGLCSRLCTRAEVRHAADNTARGRQRNVPTSVTGGNLGSDRRREETWAGVGWNREVWMVWWGRIG